MRRVVVYFLVAMRVGAGIGAAILGAVTGHWLMAILFALAIVGGLVSRVLEARRAREAQPQGQAAGSG